MHDNRPPAGDLVLPEYQRIDQIFGTLRDKVANTGNPQMGTFLIDGELGGIMVVGKMTEIGHFSRILATIGSSPLVKMPGH